MPEIHQEPVGEWLAKQPRAQRFTIHARLQYRTAGGEWRQGTMVNISESGLLFRTNQEAPPIPEIEIRFSLRTGATGGRPAQVACHGVITRTESFPGSAEPTGFAARISKFHFERSGRPPAGLKEIWDFAGD